MQCLRRSVLTLQRADPLGVSHCSLASTRFVMSNLQRQQRFVRSDSPKKMTKKMKKAMNKKSHEKPKSVNERKTEAVQAMEKEKSKKGEEREKGMKKLKEDQKKQEDSKLEEKASAEGTGVMSRFAQMFKQTLDKKKEETVKSQTQQQQKEEALSKPQTQQNEVPSKPQTQVKDEAASRVKVAQTLLKKVDTPASPTPTTSPYAPSGKNKPSYHNNNINISNTNANNNNNNKPTTDGSGGNALASAFLQMKSDLENKVEELEKKLNLALSKPAPVAGLPMPTTLQYEVLKEGAEDAEHGGFPKGVEATNNYYGSINRVDLAGVVGKPSMKQWQTGVVAEISLTTTFSRSEVKGSGVLTEREQHKVYIHGETLVNYVMCHVRQGYLVHVQGRLTAFPRWSEESGRLVFNHAVNVHPEAGGFITILRSAASTDETYNDMEFKIMSNRASAAAAKEAANGDKSDEAEQKEK
eukprot:TRINITY_DN2911_c0_g1_i1.p1 TRINITY_DN2911_c0_g1~~TRINITY_DN2911_c0_g1_i1.p1  ORF type:complete len:468 (+),score=118.94 TRINITY_DN2911_c0_g1_i1:63-1466(+)